MKKRWIAALVFWICIITGVPSYLLWDITLARYCRELDPLIRNIADIITIFGVATWYIVGSFVLFLFFRFIYKNRLNASRFLFIFLSLGVTGILITLLKWIAGRHRPINFFQHGYYGFDFFGVGYELTSFPSGHAQTVFTLATALCILFPRWGVPLFVSAAVISSSRIILASHYLSDVIAGATVGILCTMAIRYYFDRKQIGLHSPQCSK